MQRYRVPDMSCGHCVQAITKAVKSVDPAAKVDTDLKNHEVSVDSMADPELVVRALQQAGYASESFPA